MASDIIQSNYEQLDQIAQRMAQRSESLQQLYTRVARQSQTLAQGSWQGKGSEAFAREMQSVALPGLQRLFQALRQSSESTRRISAIVKNAEQEAAALFKGEGGGGLAGLVQGVKDLLTAAAPVINFVKTLSSLRNGLLKGLVAGLKITPAAIANTLKQAVTNLPFLRSPTGAKLLEKIITKSPLKAAIIGDVVRLGMSLYKDGWSFGSETKKAVGGIAGGWAEAFAGAKGGALLGGAIGSVFPGVGTAIGAGVGGFVGGVVGAIGGNWIGEKLGGLFG